MGISSHVRGGVPNVGQLSGSGDFPLDIRGHELETSSEEVLHELRASLSGVACAVRVLLNAEHADQSRRESLERMLEAELGRLQRLLGGTASSSSRPVRVDELIEPVVTTRRLTGQEITVEHDSSWVAADGDALPTVLNLLLSNAAAHAPGAPVHIEVRSRAGRVQITVRDEGPGVPRQLRRTLFDEGVCAAHSPGQGLGLALARRLVEGVGGTLLLLDSVGGATFRADLPTPEARVVCA